MLVSFFPPGNWRQEIKNANNYQRPEHILLTRKHHVQNFNKFVTGPLGNGKKGQKNVYRVFENVALISSIVSSFIIIILSHTKQ